MTGYRVLNASNVIVATFTDMASALSYVRNYNTNNSISDPLLNGYVIQEVTW